MAAELESTSLCFKMNTRYGDVRTGQGSVVFWTSKKMNALYVEGQMHSLSTCQLQAGLAVTIITNTPEKDEHENFDSF